MKKITVGLVYGGRSAEHEISLISAQNIYHHLDRSKYDVQCIAIDKSGQWYLHGNEPKLKNPDNVAAIAIDTSMPIIVLSQNANDGGIYTLSTGDRLCTLDVICPTVHGTGGEDGAIQGLCELANLPCVGPSKLSSATCMDKEVMKRLLSYADIPNAPFWTLKKHERSSVNLDDIVRKLGSDLFVKPVNLGSSVGVSHVKEKTDLLSAIDHAFLFDNKIIIESKIEGRELECAVLGNENPKASIIGEIKAADQFYSYDTKYIDADAAQLMIPAALTDQQSESLQRTAIKAYQTMECSGMARVDMFLTATDEVIVNEINTLPGFTSISMYPKLWESSGLPMKDLLTELVDLALDEHQQRNALSRSAN